jgi:hypothetical protein
MVVILALIGIKVVPPFVENMTVSSIVTDIGKTKDIQDKDDTEIRDLFSKRFSINNISDIDLNKIQIKRENGNIYIDLNYETRVNIFRNIDAVISFKNHYDSAHL